MANGPLRRTKIVCTLGPASESPEVIRAMIREGMDVARLNFSHGTWDWHERAAGLVREAAEGLGGEVAILQDLPGPKIRVGEIRGGWVELKAGQDYTLTAEPLLGDGRAASIGYEGFAEGLKEGDRIFLADGVLELRVVGVEGRAVHCKVVVGGRLASRKGVNLPSKALRAPALTERDEEHLRFGLGLGVDMVALSFVRDPSDLRRAKRLIAEQGSEARVVAKIESQEALDNFDPILEEADGIMIARGDLGIEIPFERVPMIQKGLISKARRAGKPIITATQMLGSMAENPRPSRAEAADVANAILDGTDALMLSEETASGKYPIESVRTMAKIAGAVEESFPFHSDAPGGRGAEGDVPTAIASAACQLAAMLDAFAIVAPTETSYTARQVSRHRPKQPIIALSPNPSTVRALKLSWGVFPRRIPRLADTDGMLKSAFESAISWGAAKGDVVVAIAGHPVGMPHRTNLIRVYTVE